jgi:maltooligosyltrehalose trehalohydrolase
VDALWNDDFHHSAVVALTGMREAYFNDYRGRAHEFVAALKRGTLYQGQHYAWQKQRRGTPGLDLPPSAFVHYLENHDQAANVAGGARLHHLASPGRWRAMTAVLLLGPPVPMLFQGQEYAARQPFAFFADHDPELNAKVRAGRLEFLSQFESADTPEMKRRLAPPDAPGTFESCKLDASERRQGRHAEAWALHADLLHLRREDPVISGRERTGFDAAVLEDHLFVARFFARDGADRLLVVNLGVEWRPDVVPEPLLAPPAGARWELLWSSGDPRYGGHGSWDPETESGWRVQGETAMVLHPVPAPAAR